MGVMAAEVAVPAVRREGGSGVAAGLRARGENRDVRCEHLKGHIKISYMP